MEEITLKTKKELKIMTECGKKLAKIKNELKKKVGEGVSAQQVEKLANSLIEQSGGKASFKMVPRYRWATCVNVNEGLVHGIPRKTVIFKKGDVVSVDVGLYYQGFHTDTSLSVGISPKPAVKKFLEVGKNALKKAIDKAKIGNRIYDITRAMEEEITNNGYSPIKALVGHGVGKNLHEEPQIPCFTFGKYEESPKIIPGMVLAIEVMYSAGSSDVVTNEDGWTISMRDGKISGLFEETVAITNYGPLVLT